MASLSGSIRSIFDKQDSAIAKTTVEPLIQVDVDGVSPYRASVKKSNAVNPFAEADGYRLADEGSNMAKKGKIKTMFKESCGTEMLLKRVPITEWLPKYNKVAAMFDLIAGITVGLTVIPQSMAYAAVAGLPLEYGLYSSFMGLFAYTVLGSVKESSIGPTAVMALMTYSYANEGGPAYASLLSFLAGWIELIAGLLNLGFLVEFISAPVISGFCSAAALTVASTQIKGLFGLKFKAASFVEIWAGFFSNITNANPWDTSLGCAAILVLLLMRKLSAMKNLRPFKNIACLRNHFVDRCIWFISTSRNAIAVVGGCLAAYLLQMKGHMPFTLTGDIKPGLPSFALPAFSVNMTNDATNSTVSLSFVEICSELGAAIGLIPLIAILEQVAIAKAFACGKQTDATQEMIALGAGNILGSFFGAIPITSSFGRSSVQSASGVKTPLANVYAGILVLLALGFLMPSLAYIPKAILSAVIITSVIFMVEYEELKPLWKGRRVELIPFVATFACCLFLNMEYGILIGAGIHLLLLSYRSSRPHPRLTILSENDMEEKCVVTADINMYFPGVEKFRAALKRVAARKKDAKNDSCLFIDLSNVREIDYTALKMLKSLAEENRKQGMTAIRFVNASPALVKSITSVLSSENAAFLSMKISDYECTSEI